MGLEYKFKAQNVIDEGRTTREAVEEMKKWMLTEKLPEVPEEMLVLFLLSCKNVVGDAQNTVRAYFKIKSEAPEMFTDRDIDNEELKKASNVVNSISIPRRMANNTVIHFFKVVDPNYQNFDWLQAMKLAYMLLDISQRSNPPNELVVLIDMKGIGFMHLTRFKLGAAKKFLEFLQEAMPLRMKVIHIINSNYILDKLISIARVFIKSELMALIKSHPPETDMTQFIKDHIPASCMPKEYGGDLPSTAEMNEISVQKLRELKPFFEAEEKMISFYK